MNKEAILQQLKEYSQRRKVQPVLKEQIDRLKKRAVLRKSEGAIESERQAQERMRSIKRLEEAYRFNRRRQKSMDICLNTLEHREKTVLWYFYIDRPSDYIDRLADELGIERSQIYRVKDRALKNLGKVYFGLSR